MHFTYAKELDPEELRQGDVLRRTAKLNGILERESPTVFRDASIEFLVVLTQSCDLVVRPQYDGNVRCMASFIALAPIRGLESVLKEYVDRYRSRDIDKAFQNTFGEASKGRIPICSKRARRDAEGFLARLFNNNHDDYFYLEAAPEADFPGDGCADLAFFVTLPTAEAHSVCLGAKTLELSEEFRPKLGWLVGRMYSRVGTQDWPAAQMSQKVAQTLKGAAVWITDRKLERLKKRIKGELSADEGFGLTDDGLEAMLRQLPSRREVVITEIVSLARKHMNPEDSAIFERSLESSAVIRDALKE